MNFVPEGYAETIKLNVLITQGRLSMLDGTALPPLRDHTRGELVILADSITDEDIRNKLTRKHSVPLIPKDTTLWAQVRMEGVSDKLARCRQTKHLGRNRHEMFVAFSLNDDLHITLRGAKLALLHDCTCDIPALDRQAGSINQAYTLISTAFEPTRRSHTGNVFQKIFIEEGGWMQPLDELRARAEGDFSSDEPPKN